MKVNTAALKMETLDGAGKTNYYLILGEKPDELIINVGMKTYTSAQILISKEISDKIPVAEKKK